MSASSFPFPLVDVEGDARERGRQYGSLAAERIATSLRVYMAAWTAGAGAGAARAALLARARKFEPVIGDRYPELLEEMRGIAEGAGRAIEEIVALNARTELLYGEPADGCTGAVLLPERTGGPVIIGQNWDWRPACREAAIVLRVTPERGPGFLTFVEAGMLARSGMNSAGIGLCGNFLNSDMDGTQRGVPIPVIRRAILMSPSLPTAVGEVLRAPRAFSSNHQEVVIRNVSRAPVVASVIGGRFHEGAPGLDGGARGGTGVIAVNDGAPLGQSSQVLLEHGARILMRFPGGGGFGDPRQRAPEAVLADVRRGFVSPERAREDYGVALRPGGREIDAEETARLRRHGGSS